MLLNIFQHVEWQTSYPAQSTNSPNVKNSWNKVPMPEGFALCAQGLWEVVSLSALLSYLYVHTHKVQYKATSTTQSPPIQPHRTPGSHRRAVRRSWASHRKNTKQAKLPSIHLSASPYSTKFTCTTRHDDIRQPIKAPRCLTWRGL